MILQPMDTKKNKALIPDIEVLYRQVFVFILDIIEYTDVLKKHNKHTIANKLLELTTLWGELLNASRTVIKIKSSHIKLIQAHFEADNIKYWLNLCKYSHGYPSTGTLTKDIDKLSNNISALANDYLTKNSIK